MKSSPITERASSRLARASAMNELSACRTIAGGSSLSCSSSISPTICSTMSSIDTSPSVPPYSSTTGARGAAIFVDRQRQMDARGLHLRQQVDRPHRRWYEKQLADDVGVRQRQR